MKRLLIATGAALIALSACGGEREAEVAREGVGEGEGLGEAAETPVAGEGLAVGEGEAAEREGGVLTEGAVGEGEAAEGGIVEGE